MNGIPHANVRFSLIHNDIASPILACGSCVEIPSFIFKNRQRHNHTAYNMESAWFAALNMLDKRAGFRYIPHRYLNINDKPIHYIGEVGGTFSEYHIDGDPRSDKFIIWFFKGEEIVSFLTVGYINVHLYLWEAMQ